MYYDQHSELEISLFLLRRLLGVKTEDKKQTKVSKLAKNELLLINIGSTSTGGRVLSVKADLAKIQLTSPACTEIGEKVALSRRIEKHWRLVGEVLVEFAIRKHSSLCSQVGEVFNEESNWKLTRRYIWREEHRIPSFALFSPLSALSSEHFGPNGCNRETPGARRARVYVDSFLFH